MYRRYQYVLSPRHNGRLARKERGVESLMRCQVRKCTANSQLTKNLHDACAMVRKYHLVVKKGEFQDIPNECNAMLIRRAGLNILSLGVHAYCLLFKGYDVKVSAAMNTLRWMADTLSSLRNKKFEPSDLPSLGTLILSHLRLLLRSQH